MKTPGRGDLRHMAIRLWRQMDPRRRRQYLKVAVLIVTSAVAEVATVGMVVPFLAILISPENFRHNQATGSVLSGLLHSSASATLLVTATFALASILAATLRLLVLCFNTRLAYATGADLSSEIYQRALYQPYQSHILTHTSETISNGIGKTGDVVVILTQLSALLNAFFLLIFVSIGLVVLQPTTGACVILGLGGAYALTVSSTRRLLRIQSNKVGLAITQVVKAMQDGLGGARDVLLDGTQAVHYNNYRVADRALRRAQAAVAIVSGSPRFALEALLMVLLAVVGYFMSLRTPDLAATLPILGALALGVQRLLPVMQQGFSAWANIIGRRESLMRTLDILERPNSREASVQAMTPVEFHDHIRFDSVSFRYSTDGPWVVKDFDLAIRKGLRVGVVGRTGSGKSTAIDLLLGLLTPTQGCILVDGEPLVGARVRSWQRRIAHVPQKIFLADATFLENIAFGTTSEAIDIERVRRAAHHAQIAKFIEKQPEGYHTRVGEHGIRLSGGQRQRIGIARALFKKASVMIFDEATCALDNLTELSILDAIGGLDRGLTIILIAHRITSVRHCDLIVEMQDGRIVAQGTYQQLMVMSSTFRDMTRVADVAPG
jgi:ATP-binding cassette, subfamily B, bacterial PglK